MNTLNGKKNILWPFFKKLYKEVYKVLCTIEHSLLVTDYPNGRTYPCIEIERNFRHLKSYKSIIMATFELVKIKITDFILEKAHVPTDL